MQILLVITLTALLVTAISTMMMTLSELFDNDNAVKVFAVIAIVGISIVVLSYTACLIFEILGI